MAAAAPIGRRRTALFSACRIADGVTDGGRGNEAPTNLQGVDWTRLRGLISEHGGWVVNATDRSLLAGFATAADAVGCAVDAQSPLQPAARNDLALDPAIAIAVHVGEVMVYGDDLFGDGVTQIGRVLTHGRPGDILITAPAYHATPKALLAGALPLATDGATPGRVAEEVYRISLSQPALPQVRGPAGGQGQRRDHSAGPFAKRPAPPLWESRLHRDAAIAGLCVVLSLIDALSWLVVAVLIYLLLALCLRVREATPEPRPRRARQALVLAGFLIALNLVTSATPLWSLAPAAVLGAMALWLEPTLLSRLSPGHSLRPTRRNRDIPD